MRTSTRELLLFSFLAGIILISCTRKKDDVNPQPANATVKFDFKHFVGSNEVEFNTIKYTNAYGNIYSVENLKYFVSNITLHLSLIHI